jgi:hypothetical protein
VRQVLQFGVLRKFLTGFQQFVRDRQFSTPLLKLARFVALPV